MNRKHLVAAMFLVVLGCVLGIMITNGVNSTTASPSQEPAPREKEVVEKTVLMDAKEVARINTPNDDGTSQEYEPSDLRSAVESALGSTWDITFEVQSTMQTGAGLVLNDQPYKKNGPRGKTVFVPKAIAAEQLPGVRVAAQLRGKKLRVLGVVDEFRDEKQLKAEHIEVLP